MYGYTPYTDPGSYDALGDPGALLPPAVCPTATGKVVFLDIDGVLQPSWSNARFEHDLDETVEALVEERQDGIYRLLDPYDVAAVRWDWDEGAVERVRKLCEQTGASIVVESDWREYVDEDGMRALLAIWGLDEHFAGNAAGGQGPGRIPKDVAITDYVESRYGEIGSYVVIDDRCVFSDMRRQVQPISAFDEADLERALAILG